MSDDKPAAFERPYADPAHKGNRLRPRVRCVGCGAKGCVTAWGPWCFKCNVERMDRISATLEPIRAITAPETANDPR
jgi:hypothetical protein